MSGKRNKKLRKRGKQILVDWLHSLLPNTEDRDLITTET